MSGKQDLTRQEEFKRATAGVLRAMAHADAEVQVAFQPGPSGVAGKRVRLPLPTRALPANEMAKLRGAADAAALKLRHHDEALHASRIPARREAKEVFDALEQVRVEAVGSRHMAGVAANLRAKLIDECEAEGYDRMTRKDQMPLSAALGLIARERLTGEAAPEAAHRVLDLWRDTIGEDAEQALTEMTDTAGDQGALARAARKLLTALDLAEAEMEAESEQQDEEGEEGGESTPQQDQSGEGQSQSEQEDEMLGAQPEQMQGEASEEEAEESEEDGAAADGDDKPGGPQQRREVPQVDDTTRYHAFTTQFDEVVAADDLCDPEELTRLRQQLDSSFRICRAWCPNSPIVCNAACSRSNSAPGISIWKKAFWMSRGWPALSPTRPIRCPTSVSVKRISATR